MDRTRSGLIITSVSNLDSTRQQYSASNKPIFLIRHLNSSNSTARRLEWAQKHMQRIKSSNSKNLSVWFSKKRKSRKKLFTNKLKKLASSIVEDQLELNNSSSILNELIDTSDTPSCLMYESRPVTSELKESMELDYSTRRASIESRSQTTCTPGSEQMKEKHQETGVDDQSIDTKSQTHLVEEKKTKKNKFKSSSLNSFKKSARNKAFSIFLNHRYSISCISEIRHHTVHSVFTKSSFDAMLKRMFCKDNKKMVPEINTNIELEAVSVVNDEIETKPVILEPIIRNLESQESSLRLEYGPVVQAKIVKEEPTQTSEDLFVSSGKSNLGLKSERLRRKYSNMEPQRKYLLAVNLILIILLLIISSTLVITIFKEVFSFSIEPVAETNTINATTMLAITLAEKLVSVQTGPPPPKVPGLVGDMCEVSTRNCSKYMECKEHVSPFFSGWFCACLDGYVSNFERNCKGLVKADCDEDSDCEHNMLCDHAQNQCQCKSGFQINKNGKCFGAYNTRCKTDQECLKNAECRKPGLSEFESDQKYCLCYRNRTIYISSYDFYEQCRGLAGAPCHADDDCIENTKCKSYCSCNELDLFFETERFTCDDGCRNKAVYFPNSTRVIKYPHPSKCGFYYTCSPRELDSCPSRYTFNATAQSCDSKVLCS